MCEIVSDSPESLCNPRPRRPSDHWTKASQLFADNSQDPVKQSNLIEKPATTSNEWMTWIRPSPVMQPGRQVTSQLVQPSPRAKNVYSLITTFREIHKYPWALCLPAVSLEKLPKSVRLTGNPWDLTGLILTMSGRGCMKSILTMSGRGCMKYILTMPGRGCTNHVWEGLHEVYTNHVWEGLLTMYGRGCMKSIPDPIPVDFFIPNPIPVNLAMIPNPIPIPVIFPSAIPTPILISSYWYEIIVMEFRISHKTAQVRGPEWLKTSQTEASLWYVPSTCDYCH